MTSGQKRFPIAPSSSNSRSTAKAECGVSELLPNLARSVDDICFIRSMQTDAINHEPAISYMQTGNQITGRPCLGSWVSYGLGSMNQDLPTFVVLVAKPTNTEQVQAISARLWSSGYLSGEHAGVSFRSGGDPILYINNPPGVPSSVRRNTLDGLRELNELNYRQVGDPETHTRIQQYELAFRMQSSVPELTDVGNESAATYALYGEAARKPGSFAHSVLLARRMIERGVRFVQIYLNNWDTHGNVAGRLPDQCRDIDQACHGLIQDLKARGMFDDTLIVGGVSSAARSTRRADCQRTTTAVIITHAALPCGWLVAAAGGGQIYGETDEFSYNIVRDPVHVRDFHATVLKLLGFDHERFTYRYQGLDQRLTTVEPAHVIPELLA